VNELPLLLDAPVVRRRFVSAPAGSLAATPALGRSRPAWMAPAWVIGRFRPQLRAATTADAAALERFPRQIAEAGPLLLVLLLAAGFAALHGLHSFYSTKPDVEWARLSLANTYLEIPIFLFLAILVGVAAPSLGVLLVLVYAALDLVASTSQPEQYTPFPGALAGRLVSLWLLWLLVVEIPVLARSLAVSWRALARNRFVVAALAALVTGAFTWFWTLTAPILIRPMFVWSNIGKVGLAAILPVQSAGAVFAIFAGVVAGAVALSRGPDRILQEDSASEPPGTPKRGVAIARTLAVAALVTVTLGGLLATPLEAAAMFAVLASAGPLARFLADRTILGSIVRITPPVLRYAVAAGLSFGVAAGVVGSLYQANVAATINNPKSEFFSVLFSLAIAFFLVALATTPGAKREGRSTVASTAMTLLVVGGALFALILATPVTALADNCSGLTDCWPTALLAALAGGGLPMALAAASKQPDPPPPPPPGPPPPPAPPDRKFNRDKAHYFEQRKKFWEKNWPNEKDEPRYCDKMIKYWRSDPPGPSSDGKPVRLGALANSAAAGRM
jgi:hypothetical protein